MALILFSFQKFSFQNSILTLKVSSVEASKMEDESCELKSSWTELASLPAQTTSAQSLYYLGMNDKEWIIHFLADGTTTNINSHSCDMYFYDVEQDKYATCTPNCLRRVINETFNIKVYKDKNNPLADDTPKASYVIDNNKHILYCLYLQNAQGSMITIDVKNFPTIKLIDQTILTLNIRKAQYTLLLVDNTIQIVLGYNSVQHYQYNIDTKQVSIVHKNIHSKSTSHITNSQMQYLFDNLKCGDYIDVKDNQAGWYLAKILDIKNKQYYSGNSRYNYNYDGNDYKSKLRSMDIFIHYQGLKPERDESIHVTRDSDLYSSESNANENANENGNKHRHVYETKCQDMSSLCDCNEKCWLTTRKHRRNKLRYRKCHMIALPLSQSMVCKALHNFRGLYSKNRQKMIIVGGSYDKMPMENKFGGIYYKYMNPNHDNKNQVEMIVNGFIHKFENDCNSNYNCNYNIPKELCQMIFKYYCQPSDKEWQYGMRLDENGLLPFMNFKNKYPRLYQHSGYVLVNNDNDIFILGGKNQPYRSSNTYISKLNVESWKLERLANVQCPKVPKMGEAFNFCWYTVFCKKSQMIHTFAIHHKSCAHFSIHLDVLNSATIENQQT